MSDTIKPVGYEYGGWSITKDRTVPNGFVLSDDFGYGIDTAYLDRDRLSGLMVLLQHVLQEFKEETEEDDDGDEG